MTKPRTPEFNDSRPTRVAEIYLEIRAQAEVEAAEYEEFLPPWFEGRHASEANRSAPYITWVESEEGEEITHPRQDEDDLGKIGYERVSPVAVEIHGRDRRDSEDILHQFLRALHNTVTPYTSSIDDMRKGGGGAGDRGHVRAFTLKVSVPVAIETWTKTPLLRATVTTEAAHADGSGVEVGVTEEVIKP